ncbi:hypothetical protein [Rhizomonospora bruguierae]|uniref:hypothetical protein n=1 Tax=Rhizomonospora bruguierae TaxID=1581705 RepID=UPI001BCC355C|nr:hypothetical protein [Micromonospora sp. NBRC 107566]
MLDRVPVRLVAFASGLVLALLAGLGIGRLAGPAPAPPKTTDMGAVPIDESQPHSHGGDATGQQNAGEQVAGLAVSSGGYTLVPERAEYPAATPPTFRFRVDGPDRRPVTTFAVKHEKLMHLIVARRDLSGYQHVHPTLAPDGTWSVDLAGLAPGLWRAFADFAALDAAGTEHPLTLGVDLTVPGTYAPKALPGPERTARVGGFDATYEGTPQVGSTQPLLFRVFRDGSPVTALERYLGAYGHLVVLREGDLGYVHVHPEERLVDGAVKFWLAAPSPGRYRMYLDFQVAGQVHTAEYTLVVS